MTATLATKWAGDYHIIPIDSPDGTTWRYIAIIDWIQPGDDLPRMVCRRHPCPLRLARWVYAKARAIRWPEVRA